VKGLDKRVAGSRAGHGAQQQACELEHPRVGSLDGDRDASSLRLSVRLQHLASLRQTLPQDPRASPETRQLRVKALEGLPASEDHVEICNEIARHAGANSMELNMCSVKPALRFFLPRRRRCESCAHRARHGSLRGADLVSHRFQNVASRGKEKEKQKVR
jgi:hypothetical protein